MKTGRSGGDDLERGGGLCLIFDLLICFHIGVKGLTSGQLQ